MLDEFALPNGGLEGRVLKIQLMAVRSADNVFFVIKT